MAHDSSFTTHDSLPDSHPASQIPTNGRRRPGAGTGTRTGTGIGGRQQAAGPGRTPLAIHLIMESSPAPCRSRCLESNPTQGLVQLRGTQHMVASLAGPLGPGNSGAVSSVADWA
jgi:hypothetical protein